MKKIRNYLKLMRIKHWFKNIIVFIPAFYGGAMMNINTLFITISGFIVFSLFSSAIYVINDLCDIENDKQHPIKCRRPLACGAVGKTEGYIIIFICIISAFTIDILLNGINSGTLIPFIYFFSNIFYSKLLKKRPVADLVILVSGFVLRILYGSFITSVKISAWLYLTIISLSLFMAFGKRRNEKISCGNKSRAVLNSYSMTYLNSCMYMYLSVFIVFYALWSVDPDVIPEIRYTTPLVIVMVMRYTYLLENDEYGDPLDMILSDKTLIILGIIYAVFIYLNIYILKV